MGRKRTPGGDRKPSKPDYNPSAILQNQMDAAVVIILKLESHLIFSVILTFESHQKTLYIVLSQIA